MGERSSSSSSSRGRGERSSEDGGVWIELVTSSLVDAHADSLPVRDRVDDGEAARDQIDQATTKESYESGFSAGATAKMSKQGLPGSELVPRRRCREPSLPGANGVRGEGEEHVFGKETGLELCGNVRGEASIQEPARFPTASEERQREVTLSGQIGAREVDRMRLRHRREAAAAAAATATR